MERYIVLIEKTVSEDALRWTLPVKEFFQRTYPDCITSTVKWNGSGAGMGYGIIFPKTGIPYCDFFNQERVKYLQEEMGYTVLTRSQVAYSENIKRILE